MIESQISSYQMRKPFDILVEGRFLEKSGGHGIRTHNPFRGT